ncbi:MAG TPA: nickel pincer cofactor biosynthesis protein LarC [Lachnospiraceae bacterium]|nr:nickel pincer cofactor biosynthesis protein LarC [Lachnospiraceae bacterium]
MGNTLYLECASGISGDMTVAALLDLGADEKVLEKALRSLPVKGFETKISRVKKSGLDACDFQVMLDAAHENHDHDMEYLHGHSHDHDHEHGHDHHHTHEHRGLPEILEIISGAEMTARAKDTAIRIFTILAQAESKAHGLPMEQVHFHEVGAVDSIVDIVAAAVCLDNLDITEAIIPRLNEGQGFVRCQHGVIPVPVPAVVHIAEMHHLMLHMTEVEGELVTPTGAAIVAAIRTGNVLPAQFTIEKTGMGAGKRNYSRPSLLRAMLIKEAGTEEDVIYKLESNIDDCSGESLGYAMRRLLNAGARDVHYTPVFMKKNRPAYQLNVVCREEDIPKLEQIIFEETTTIGIRRVRMERTVLQREQQQAETSLGTVEVKCCTLPNGAVRKYPEYDSVIRLAETSQISYQEACRQIQKEIR